MWLYASVISYESAIEKLESTPTRSGKFKLAIIPDNSITEAFKSDGKLRLVPRYVHAVHIAGLSQFWH